MRQYELLRDALRCAVPLLIHQYRDMDPDQRVAIAREAAEHVAAAHGDVLVYGSETPCATAKVFNALARGLAALACQPGGVDFAGLHWCVNHQECERRRLPPPCETANIPPKPPSQGGGGSRRDGD